MPHSDIEQDHGLSSQIRSLGVLLSEDRYYAIPYLQRPYEWSEQEVGDMVGDLLAAHEGGYRHYFLGHIVGVVGSDGRCELVDGQQRLTTFTIMLAYIVWRLSELNPAASAALQDRVIGQRGPRLELRAADAEFMFRCVQTPGAIAALAEADRETGMRTDAQSAITQAARVVHSKLERLDAGPLAAFARFLTDRALVDFITAPDRSGAAMLYRGMNLRGRMLSTADLIKLEAIENTGLAPERREEAARVWEAQEDALGREDFSFLLEILPLLISRETASRPGDLTEWREQAFKNVPPDHLLLDLLPQYAAIMRELLLGEIQCDVTGRQEEEAIADVNRRLRGLLFLQDRLWLAPAIAAVAANRLRPIYLSAFFTGLDRLAFACFLDAVRHEDRPARFAAAVRFSDKGRMDAAFSLKPAEEQAVVERLMKPFQRHGWRRRTIAIRANSAFKNGYTCGTREDVTVEHILPSSYNRDWAAEGWSQKDAHQCANLLGNFALLTVAENQAASGKVFREKARVYFPPERWQEAHPLTKDVKRYSEWTAAVVQDRTRRLTEMLLADWDIRGA